MTGIDTRLHDLGEFIRDQRRTARLSLRKLSELAGISNPYLSQIERGLRKPSAEILRDSTISERHKQTLIAISRTFQQQRAEEVRASETG